MRRLVKVEIQAVIEAEDESELEEVVEDIVRFGDWDVDHYTVEDCGEVDE